jgi:hypothetical protein
MKHIIKTNFTIDVSEALKVIEKIPVKWNTQLCVTSRTGADDFFDGAGSINSYDSKEYDFNVVNNFFKGTVFERVLNDIHAAGYKFGRVRIMRMFGKSAYSYHMDCEERMHFALQTSDNCMLIIDDIMHRIPSDGHGYLANTTLPHTAINCTDAERIHLVIDIIYEVTKLADSRYSIMGKELSEQEFQQWLVETKPPTDQQRTDYYFV